MGFKSLLSSQLQYDVTRSASAFLGKVGADSVRGLFPDTTSNGPTTFDQGLSERLAERARIAQDLHDTLLQGFFAASMQLHTAVDSLPNDCVAKPQFSSVLQAMDRVLEDGRRAVQGLRSNCEHISSLGRALAGVPKDLCLPSAVGFRVVVMGRERDVRPGVSDELYQIGREAIVNAYRHSRAKHIETEIEYRPAELHIVVRDNGCGIDPQELKWGRPGHWGLQGMRERAERIGAQLRLLSKLAAGTEVELCVPSGIAFGQREVGAAC